MFFGIILGIMCTVVYRVHAESQSNEQCSSKAMILHIQKRCAVLNQALMEAEENVSNRTAICPILESLLKCAVSERPHCYDQIDGMFHNYWESPYFCVKTKTFMLELQNIVMSHIRNKTASHSGVSPSAQLPTSSLEDRGPDAQYDSRLSTQPPVTLASTSSLENQDSDAQYRSSTDSEHNKIQHEQTNKEDKREQQEIGPYNSADTTGWYKSPIILSAITAAILSRCTREHL